MISLLLLLACSANALEVRAPSPNSGTITPDAITVKGSTLTVATTGIVSAPSQPRARVTVGRPISAAAWQPVFFQNEVEDKQNLFDATDSSATFTIPTGGGGWYYAVLHVAVPVEGSGGVANFSSINLNNASCSSGSGSLSPQKPWVSTANLVTQMIEIYNGPLSAGDTVTACTYFTAAGTPDTNAYKTNFSLVKVW